MEPNRLDGLFYLLYGLAIYLAIGVVTWFVMAFLQTTEEEATDRTILGLIPGWPLLVVVATWDFVVFKVVLFIVRLPWLLRKRVYPKQFIAKAFDKEYTP